MSGVGLVGVAGLLFFPDAVAEDEAEDDGSADGPDLAEVFDTGEVADGSKGEGFVVVAEKRADEWEHESKEEAASDGYAEGKGNAVKEETASSKKGVRRHGGLAGVGCVVGLVHGEAKLLRMGAGARVVWVNEWG